MINALGTDGATAWLSFLIRIDGEVVGSDISADVRLDDGLGNHLYIGDRQRDGLHPIAGGKDEV